MIRAAIVGLGPHGMRMLKAALRIDAIELVAVVDRDENKLAQTEVVESGAIAVNELSLVWQHNIQLLMVATNGPSHAAIGLEGIQKGITHLVISKPFTCTLQDAIKLNQAAQASNVRLVVDHLNRYDFTYNWIKDKIDSNIWGKLISMYLQRPGIGLGCVGVHSFDLANFLLNKTPETVTGWIDEPVKKNPRGEQFVDPGGQVILRYGDGIRAVIEQVEDSSGPQSVEIVCKHARIRVDEKYGILEIIETNKDFVPGPNKKAPLNKLINPHIPEFKLDTVELLVNMLTELVSANAISANGAAGQSAVEILVAAYISSSNSNMSVHLPLKEEAHLNLFLPVT